MVNVRRMDTIDGNTLHRRWNVLQEVGTGSNASQVTTISEGNSIEVNMPAGMTNEVAKTGKLPCGMFFVPGYGEIATLVRNAHEEVNEFT